MDFLHDLRSKHSEIMYGAIIREITSSTLMVHSYSFGKILKSDCISLMQRSISPFNASVSTCGFVGVNLCSDTPGLS
jgi:hypothetical protein